MTVVIGFIAVLIFAVCPVRAGAQNSANNSKAMTDGSAPIPPGFTINTKHIKTYLSRRV
jgi:hypothetical protein